MNTFFANTLSPPFYFFPVVWLIEQLEDKFRTPDKTVFSLQDRVSTSGKSAYADRLKTHTYQARLQEASRLFPHKQR